MSKKAKNAALKILSANLRKVLSDRSLSARAGAAIAGVPVTTFTAWVNGTSLPMDPLALQRFCSYAGVSFEWLCTGKIETVWPEKFDEKQFELSSGESVLRGVFFIEAKKIRMKGKKER